MSKIPVSTIETDFEQDQLMETETQTYGAIGLGDIWIEKITYTNPGSLQRQQYSLQTPYGAQSIDKMDMANLIMLLAHVLNDVD